MKTPVRRPSTSRLRLSTANGENQDSWGSSEPAGASSAATLTSATAAKIRRATTCAPIMKRCTCADSSVPSTQIHVITPMITIANIVTAAFESRRPSRLRMSKM
jgi:hypothetical protein